MPILFLGVPLPDLQHLRFGEFCLGVLSTFSTPAMSYRVLAVLCLSSPFQIVFMVISRVAIFMSCNSAITRTIESFKN